MSKSVKEMLRQEAEAAEKRAAAEERGEVEPKPVQRARKQSKDPSQVYSVRIPAEQIEQLRLIAVERGKAPTVLMREWVLDRLAEERGTPGASKDVSKLIRDAFDGLGRELILVGGQIADGLAEATRQASAKGRGTKPRVGSR